MLFANNLSVRSRILLLHFAKRFKKSNNNTKNAFVEICDNPEEAIRDIKSDDKILVGGFGLCGVPEALINALSRTSSKNFVIVSNDGGNNNHGIDVLFRLKKVKKIIGSFLGENKEYLRQYLSGELEVELIPQGSLVEKIRCGGAGIPGFYTATGLNTLVQLGGEPIKYNHDGTVQKVSLPKDTKVFDGKQYLLEHAITGDFALIRAWKADKYGNLIFRKSANNFNLAMAKAAKITIAEVEEILEIGQLDPNFVHLSSIYVDRIVKAEPYEKYIEKRVIHSDNDKKSLDSVRERIARRAALEFKNGDYANLGIGIPVLAAEYIPKGVKVLLQAENGVLGMVGFFVYIFYTTDVINFLESFSS
jgi:3-oxoacid CoA-transferase